MCIRDSPCRGDNIELNFAVKLENPLPIPFPNCEENSFPAALTNVEIAPGKALKIFPTIGIKFLNKNVDVVDTNAFNGPCKSRPSDKFPRTLDIAAFIESNDPLKVDAASLEVVPVMSISVWIA